jgi:uncharacterized protein (DUF58 family)
VALAFVPAPRGLLFGAALLPVAIVASPVPGAAWAVLGAGAVLAGAVLRQGLRHPGAGAVSLERVLPRTLSVGEAATIRLRIRNRTAKPLSVRLADGCPPELRPDREVLDLALAPFAEGEVSYGVEPTARGGFPFLPVDVRLGDGLGLVEHRLTIPLPGDARVHPNLRNLARYALRARRDLLQQGGGRRTRILGRDGDFERLRDFVPGDDLRHIDWRATARARSPITRVYQAERAQNLLILVDGTRLMAARAGDLTKMDHAVNAALMLAWVGLTRGDRVGVGVFDDGLRAWLPPQGGTPQFGRVLDLLFDQQPELRFPRYREAARALTARNRRRSLVVWLTDLLDGEQGRELLGALRALRRRHLSLVVAMDDPEVHALADQDVRDEAALFQRAGAHELLDERDALIRKLHAEGAQVLDKRPDEITAALVDRYLEIKQRGAL